MKTPARAALFVAALAAASTVSAIESQAIRTVEALPVGIRQVFDCGKWSSAGRSGHFRIVLVDVSGGAGTEVYVQRVQEPDALSNAPAGVVETMAIRELNDDHAQYLVTAARCVRDDTRGTVELRAAFEHDVGSAQRRIRIVLASPGGYRVTDQVLRPKRR